MVVETMWPEYAPWWLNMFIWMATFWWYILIGFVPAFYFAVTKLFGFPLLQRWAKDVVIMIYPDTVKFRKISERYDSYFRDGKGVYWHSKPLSPRPFEEVPEKIQVKLDSIREKYEILAAKEVKTKQEELQMKKLLRRQKYLGKQVLSINPINRIHIYTHAVNQAITEMERKQMKVDDLLNNNAVPKRLRGTWYLDSTKSQITFSSTLPDSY